jgi:hypothetical protein
MRKMTIFRFRRIALLATAVVVVGAPLAAQQDSTAAGRQRRVHIVGAGETLWTLAEMYLGDPHLWPAIYRLNPLVVEDPHWIFPGEELVLVPPEVVQAPGGELIPAPSDTVPADESPLIPAIEGPDLEAQATEGAPPPPPPSTLPPPPPPPASTGPTVFFREGGSSSSVLEVAPPPPPRVSGRERYHAAGFLTEQEQFAWVEVLGAADRSTLSTLRATSSAIVFENVRMLAPKGATYQIGDSLLLARLSRAVQGWGRVVVPTGIVRVIAVDGRDLTGKIAVQFARITDGQFALPLSTYLDPGDVRAVPIENGLRGSIIDVRDLHPVPKLLDIVFVDRGRVDGIVPGDLFEVLARSVDRDRPPQRRVAVLKIVRVNERSATAVILALSDIGTQPDAAVRLIRKMP